MIDRLRLGNLDWVSISIDNVNCVVFLAEIVGDPSVKEKPHTALKTNFLALNSMASLCANFGVNRFIYTSSCSVYGYTKGEKSLLTEKSLVNPQSYYARIRWYDIEMVRHEKIKLGFSYLNFAKEIIKNSKVKLFLVDDKFQLAKFIKANIYGKKIVIGMGAGTISSWMRELPKLL